MKSFPWSAGALALAAMALTGCAAKNQMPAEARAILEKADRYELISLDPGAESDEKDKKADRFHGWKILGQTPIKDAETRKKVLGALLKGIEENDGSVADCFNPRHGLRATHDKKMVELVVCFE